MQLDGWPDLDVSELERLATLIDAAAATRYPLEMGPERVRGP